jgi:hypothetical protein
MDYDFWELGSFGLPTARCFEKRRLRLAAPAERLPIDLNRRSSLLMAVVVIAQKNRDCRSID